MGVCVFLPRAHAQSSATQVYSGGHHSCLVTPAGALKCWGSNSNGQLGDGTQNPSDVPVQVSGLSSGVAAVSLGDFHSCALTIMGGVKCWGWNGYGQLGVGGGDRSVPADVTGLASGVVSIESGEFHTCALTSAGGVKCWGNNFYGEIGDGTNNYSNVPVDVLGLSSGVQAIFSGHRHTCAILVGGAGKCWGANEQAQLGNGTLAFNSSSGGVSTPVEVVALSDPVVEFATGRMHTCALTTAGAVKCWGRNDGGQLGMGSAFPISYTAVQVLGLASSVAHIDAGYDDTCAVPIDGSVKCWGVNDHGQLGNGTTTTTGVAIPATMLGLASGVSRVSAAFQHTCVLTVGGSVRCAGANDDGRLGDGDPLPAADALTARPVSGFTAGVAASDVASGGMHSCQISTTGGAWCWGRNAEGQLGNGGTLDSLLPVPVSGLASGVAAIATGGTHTCALVSGGSVECWGANDLGQLGVSGANRNMPVDVPGLSAVVAIAAGWSHTCALDSAGGVKCWGDNARGQLGDGSETGRATSAGVAGLASGVTAITAGASHTCALLSTHGAKCWGWNANGQLGNGTLSSNDSSDSIAMPVDVAGAGTPIDRISAGGGHTCAVVGGAAKCWGRGDSGELGDGNAVGSLVPVGVSGLASGVADIAAGNAHSCALTAAGAVLCWGSNSDGRLGNGTIAPTAITPVAALGFASGGAARISAGFEQTCALAAGGWARCWGENDSGQLGDGTVLDRTSPTEVMVRAQSIDFSPPQAIKVGVPTALAAVTLSALDARFDTWSPTACAITGSSLVASKAGLCGVRALQDGNAAFLAAPSQLRILVVGKGDQAIAFAALGPQRLASSFTVSASSSSGLPVVFSSLTTPVCTVSGNAVSIVAMGTCSIAADQPGDANYNPAARLTQSFGVIKADQAITFLPLAAMSLTSPTFAVFATASSGLAVAFSSAAPGVCTVTGSTVTLIAVGTCTIAADQAGDSDYNPAAQVTQTFQVFADARSLPRLANISTRARVLTDNNVMIGGFVIGGSTSKTVVVRARGPSLGQFGIPNALADPTLTLVRSSDQTVVAANDDWQRAGNAADIQASGFVPSDPHESAILVSLAPGAYTAIVAGAGGGTGVGIIEVFEVDHPEVPLENLSTRAQVLTGNDVMIGGFVVQGGGPKTVVVRARGPSLARFGIANPLPDPSLTLVRSSDQSVVATNGDWRNGPNAAWIEASGLAPSDSLESAILVTLDPGAYTAVVSGAGGGTGIAIIEVFAQ